LSFKYIVVRSVSRDVQHVTNVSGLNDSHRRNYRNLFLIFFSPGNHDLSPGARMLRETVLYVKSKYFTVLEGVVKANSQSNGNGQISTRPRGSKTLERISLKLCVCNCVVGVTTHTNPHGATTTCWPGRHVVYLSFLLCQPIH